MKRMRLLYNCGCNMPCSLCCFLDVYVHAPSARSETGEGQQPHVCHTALLLLGRGLNVVCIHSYRSLFFSAGGSAVKCRYVGASRASENVTAVPPLCCTWSCLRCQSLTFSHWPVGWRVAHRRGISCCMFPNLHGKGNLHGFSSATRHNACMYAQLLPPPRDTI